MKIERVVLVGGSGFLGSAVANRLCEAGVEVVVPTRHYDHARHLLLLPTAEIVEANVHDPAALQRLVAGADAVVNLVGILHSRSGRPFGPDFARVHVELPKTILHACRAAGVRRVVHVSALGADPEGPSEYQRSKAAGEAAVRAVGDAAGGVSAAVPSWVILRPSVLFGRGDNFLNLFARLAKWFPVLPLARARARFQPVYVEDVAEVVHRCLIETGAAGQTFEVAGPTVYALRELVQYVCELSGRSRLIVPLPDGLAMLQAAFMELAPKPVMTRDNVRSMQVDNVASGAPLPFGMSATPLEAIAPSYIGEAGPRARFYPIRGRAGRGRE